MLSGVCILHQSRQSAAILNTLSIGAAAIQKSRAVKGKTDRNIAHKATAECRKFRTSNFKLNLLRARKPWDHRHKRKP